MFDKPNSLHTLGIEIEGPYVRAVQLSLVKGKPSIGEVFEYEIAVPQTTVEQTNPLYISDEGQLLKKSISSHLVVTTLKASDVLVRPLEIKLKKDSDVDSVLGFQAEPLLPYPPENAVLDRIKLGKGLEGTRLTIVAARKDYVQQHLSQWELLGLDPEVVTCAPAALSSFSKYFSSSEEALFILHLGATETTFVLAKEGKLLAAQSSPTGTKDLQHALLQDRQESPLVSLDFSSIDPTKMPLLFAAMESWRLEVTRVLFALAKQCKDQTIHDVFLTGEGAALLNLGAFLGQNLNKNLLAPEDRLSSSLSVTKLQRLAVPIGAAISGLPHEDQINFRQQEFAYPHPWKRLKKSLVLYYLMCTAVAIGIYIAGEAYIGHQEDQARQEYVNLLGAMNKQYEPFEKEYESKNMQREPEEGILTPKMLTMSGIINRLQLLQKELKDTPDTFPLLANTPRVSDVLAWLSTHPLVATQLNKKDALSPMQIDSFSYIMVKRPEIKKKQEKYQVKVEIEFSTSTPKLAREFHDALIAPNEIVDPKGEVKWSSNRGKYRASFFLKDKTIYPAAKTEG